MGETLLDLMAEGGWPGAAAWAKLGVKGTSLADAPPTADTPVDELPRLTVRMAARIQGFPDEWVFSGRKTAAYRQVGNAFPPPVARALGSSIASAFRKEVEHVTAADTGIQQQLQFI